MAESLRHLVTLHLHLQFIQFLNQVALKSSGQVPG